MGEPLRRLCAPCSFRRGGSCHFSAIRSVPVRPLFSDLSLLFWRAREGDGGRGVQFDSDYSGGDDASPLFSVSEWGFNSTGRVAGRD